MGCDTRGYIRGIELLPLISIVNEVMTDKDTTRKFLELQGVNIPYWATGEITMASVTFVYDTEANYTQPWRPVKSDKAEDRLLYIHSNVDEDPTLPYDENHTRPDALFGSLSLGMWGSATEIITLILMKAKEKGFEVYLQECDCDGDLVQL